MSARKQAAQFTVSGPQAERKAESSEAGISVATTLALRLDEEGSYYVRDKAGEIYGRADRDEHGVVRTYRIKEASA